MSLQFRIRTPESKLFVTLTILLLSSKICQAGSLFHLPNTKTSSSTVVLSNGKTTIASNLLYVSETEASRGWSAVDARRQDEPEKIERKEIGVHQWKQAGGKGSTTHSFLSSPLQTKSSKTKIERQNRPELQNTAISVVSNFTSTTETREMTRDPPVSVTFIRAISQIKGISRELNEALFSEVPNPSLKQYLTVLDGYKCGGNCRCNNLSGTDVVYADCHGKREHHLTDIPTNLPIGLTHLDLSWNNLKYLNLTRLAQYRHLRQLKLPHNYVSNVTQCKYDSILPRLHHLDLSNNKFSSLSESALSCLKNLKRLYLYKNYLKTLHNETFFGLTSLLGLDLSHNNLKSLDSGIFLSTNELKFLDLSHNNRLSLGTNFVNVLAPLKSLETLHIHNCTYDESYPGDILWQLPALKRLITNGARIPPASQVWNLTHLTIWCGKTYHWLKNVSESFFKWVPNMESITIISCQLANISPKAFDANPQLRDVCYNGIRKDVKFVLHSLENLANSTVKSLTVINNKKDVALAPLVVLGEPEVEGIRNMHQLEYLNLGANGISQLGLNFIRNLPTSLKTLSIRGNFLISSQSILNELRLQHQRGSLRNLSKLCEDNQGDTEFRETSGLSDNDCSRVEDFYISQQGAVRPSFDTHRFSLEHVQEALETDVKNREDKESPDIYSIPQEGNILQVYSASRSFNSGASLFENDKNSPSFYFLNLSSTLLLNWGNSPIRYMPRETKVVDLSENRCQRIGKEFFQKHNSLEELYARENILGPNLAYEPFGSNLSNLSKLIHLDLSHNHLFNLSQYFFQNLTSLRTLILSSNNLNTLDLRLAHMTNLTYIDLAKNSIYKITVRTRDDLDALAMKNEVKLDISFNTIPCGCDGLELMTWLSTTNVHILNKNYLKCVDKNQLIRYIDGLEETVTYLQSKCVSFKLLIIICCFVATFFALIAVFVCFFQNRWKFIYMKNRALSRLSGYKPEKLKAQQPSVFTFDAFVVYSTKTRDFVLDNILPNIERTRGHNLCVEDRDFLAGSYIPCNITSAIRTSRTTVVIIDSGTRHSGWVQYAVEMAQIEEIEAKRNVLHLLVFDSVETEKLPAIYLKIAKTGRVTEIPPDESSSEVKKEFWDGFSRLLGHSDSGIHKRQPRLELVD